MASGEDFGHLISPKTYTKVLGILMVLTVITVAVSYFDFGILNEFIAIGVAAVKAYYVVAIFMHGKFENHEIWMYIYTPLFLIGLLLSALLLDYGVRPEEDFLQDPVPLEETATYKESNPIYKEYKKKHGGDHAAEEEVPAEEPAAEEAAPVAEEAAAEPAEATTASAGGSDWGPLTGNAAAGRALAEVQCIACHVVGDKGFALPIAPAFEVSAAEERINPEYLRRWMADPQKIKPGTAMPDLPLSDEDIENLIAFLATYKK
jgi:caa(3)-type oxidase subunit IV